MTSFSISEEFLRRIFFIAQTVQSCYLASNHSKILLVHNDTMCVSVIMSQNLTRGNRFESGFISTDPAVFIALHEQVNHLITHQSVPFHEVFARAINQN